MRAYLIPLILLAGCESIPLGTATATSMLTAQSTIEQDNRECRAQAVPSFTIATDGEKARQGTAWRTCMAAKGYRVEAP